MTIRDLQPLAALPDEEAPSVCSAEEWRARIEPAARHRTFARLGCRSDRSACRA